MNWTHPDGGGNYLQIFRNPDSTIREIFRRTSFGGASANMRTRLSHDELQRLGSIRHEDSAGLLLHPSAELLYVRDAEGRLIEEGYDANTAIIGYDAEGQILSVDHSNPAYADESYGYDLGGNRLTSHLTSGSATIAPPNRLLASGDWTFSYDLAGNLIEKTDQSTGLRIEFEYDHRNRLVRAATYPGPGDPAEDVFEFEYDYLDRLLYRVINGQKTWVLHAHDHPVAEFADGSDQINAAFLFDPSLTDAVHAVWRTDALGERWFLHDQLGSVRGITYANFNLLSWVNYDSFGNLQPGSSPAMEEPIRFAARPFLAPLGLYDNRRRFMDPVHGRFTQEDPTRFAGRDFNLYRYAHNSPMMFTDPSGEVSASTFFFMVDIMVSYGSLHPKLPDDLTFPCHIANWSSTNFAYFGPLAKLIENPQSAANGASIQRDPSFDKTGCNSK